jgi:MSHA pilin protein MshC
MSISYPINKPRIRIVSIRNKGFTIIELILVIILMGILAVTVAPKMFNSEGFQEYAYQAEVITTLRNIQLKAMQQTDDGICHEVTITSKLLDITSICNNPTKAQTDQEKEWRYVPHVQIEDGHNVLFQVSGVTTNFSFDSLGRPVGCSTPCQIILQGTDNVIVQIESEGFIHAP